MTVSQCQGRESVLGNPVTSLHWWALKHRFLVDSVLGTVI